MKERGALEKLFIDTLARYDALIWRICNGYATCAVSADDLHQEVLASIWTGLESFKGASALSTWVYRVAINSCISYLRFFQRRTHHPLTSVATDIPDDNPLTNSDDAECLNYLMNSLSALDKAVLMLWLDGLSYAKIAEIIGLAPNAVGARLTRIRSKLKELWKAEQRSI